MLQCVAVCCSVLRHGAVRCSVLHVPGVYEYATHCSALHHTATHCTILQHTATHCNTLQHTCDHPQGERGRFQMRYSALQYGALRCSCWQYFAMCYTHPIHFFVMTHKRNVFFFNVLCWSTIGNHPHFGCVYVCVCLCVYVSVCCVRSICACVRGRVYACVSCSF